MSRKGVTTLVAVLSLTFFGLLACGPSLAQDVTPIPMISGIEMLKVGQTTPDFTINAVDGTPFTLSEVLKGRKGILLVFWSIFCEPCKAELPILQELNEAYKDKGIEVVGVIIDGVPMKEAVNAFLKQEKFTLRTLMDELNADDSFKVSDPFGVAGTPTLYLIDKTRAVRFSTVGRTTKEQLEESFRQLP